MAEIDLFFQRILLLIVNRVDMSAPARTDDSDGGSKSKSKDPARAQQQQHQGGETTNNDDDESRLNNAVSVLQERYR